MTTWQSIDSYLTAHGVHIGAPTLGQTVGGVHTSGSTHYAGRARDYGDANSDTGAVSVTLAPLAQGPNAPIEELFDGAHDVWFDNGQAFEPTKALRNAHLDHVHVALKPGVSLDDDWTSFGQTPVTPTSDPTKITAGLSTLADRGTAVRAVKVVMGFAALTAGLGMVIA